MVKLEHDTFAPDEIATEFRMILASAVPTDPSNIAVPIELVIRAHVAVLDATAVPDVIALAVRTPAAAAPKAVALSVSVTNRT